MYLKYYLSKFSPLIQHEDQRVCSNRWNSVADIGKQFGAYELNADDYCSMESKYCEAIKLICEYFKVKRLRIMRLEKFGFNSEKIDYSGNLIALYHSLSEGDSIDEDGLFPICRLGLRENIWCYLYSQAIHFSVAFDYDYYISIICEKLPYSVERQILDLGLYLEPAEI